MGYLAFIIKIHLRQKYLSGRIYFVLLTILLVVGKKSQFIYVKWVEASCGTKFMHVFIMANILGFVKKYTC
jgi:hypothetical protein